MHVVKRRYVDLMHGLGGIEAVAQFSQIETTDDRYGWRRWFASLFAIYDTERMIVLDLPWWNVKATHEVEQFLASRPGARVFEYGSGASTVWLAKRAREVISVEHDRPWFDKFVRQTAPHDNVSLMHRSIADGPTGYVAGIEEVGGQFDIIVVDGRHRSACLARSVSHLKPGGMVLFDDSGRTRYRAAIQSCGLAEDRYYGLSYCVPYPDYTSLLRQHG